MSFSNLLESTTDSSILNNFSQNYFQYQYRLNFLPNLLKLNILSSEFREYLEQLLNQYSDNLLPFRADEYQEKLSKPLNKNLNKYYSLYLYPSVSFLINNSQRLHLSTPFLFQLSYHLNQEIKQNSQKFIESDQLILYRGITGADAEKLYQAENKSDFILYGYISQSADRDLIAKQYKNEGIILKINYDSTVNFLIEENDFLTFPNMKFKILNKYRTEKNIIMELKFLEFVENDLKNYGDFDQYFLNFLKYLYQNRILSVYYLFHNFYILYYNALINYDIMKEIVDAEVLNFLTPNNERNWLKVYKEFLLYLAEESKKKGEESLKIRGSGENRYFEFDIVFEDVEKLIVPDMENLDGN